MNNRSYLSAISYEHGDSVMLEELQDGPVQDALVYLKAGGITRTCVSRNPIWRLASHAIKQTLSKMPMETPDAVIFASESLSEFVDGEPMYLRCWSELYSGPPMPIYSIYGQVCVSGGVAIEIADSLVKCGIYNNILVVLAEQCQSGSRLISRSLSVLSDGAASFVITNGPVGECFEVVGAKTMTNTDMAKQHLGAQTREEIRVIRNLVMNASGPKGDEVLGIRHVLCHNLIRQSQEFLYFSASVPTARLHWDLMGDVGHCFSADAIIRLDRASLSNRFLEGEEIACIFSGVGSWSVVVLKRTAEGES